MTSNYIPHEDEKSKDMKIDEISSDEDQLPVDKDGNIDWVKYYQKKTPQINSLGSCIHEPVYQNRRNDGSSRGATLHQ